MVQDMYEHSLVNFSDLHTGTTPACLSTTTDDSSSEAILEVREVVDLASVVEVVCGF